MFFVDLLSSLAETVGNFGSKGCFVVFVDEPECPQSLLK